MDHPEQTHLTVVDRHGDGLERGNLHPLRELGLRNGRLGRLLPPGLRRGPSASSSGSRAKSSRSVSSFRGVYSAAAGWKIGYSRTARAPRTSTSARPCRRVIPVGSARSSLVEKFPSVQITLGSISSTWRSR